MVRLEHASIKFLKLDLGILLILFDITLFVIRGQLGVFFWSLHT